MSRLGLVPELTFAEDFKQLRRDLEDIKKAQRVGRDILRPKVIEALNDGSPTVYDVQTEADQFGEQRGSFTAIFTADHQKEPWATPLFALYWGTPGQQPAPGDVYGSSFIWTTESAKPGQIVYRGSFGNNIYQNTTKVYLKVYMYATDTGTLEIIPEYLE